ncbi:MAG: AAA family ATPase [Gammaproteobacteria bacterium]|nr:AAA family ATPase [Gammaproteobacteria bacterium]
MTLTRRFDDSDYKADLLNLFKPGNGARPPLLAGRTAELARLGQYLTGIQGKRDSDGHLLSQVPHDIILYGPRGNGKTCLMERCRREAVRQGIDALDLRPGQVGTLEKLAGQLLFNDDKALWKLLKKGAPASLRLGLPSLAEAEWHALPPADKARLRADYLVPLLAARCAAAPLLVAVDEAHTLDPEAGRTLLNVSEQVRKQGLPFLLILAGTPNLEERLDRMDATFWSRAKKLGIGRLDEAATKTALADPLVGKGVTFDPPALDEVVEESQCYPYFIQLWGEVLCNALLEARSDVVTPDIVAAARPEAHKERDHYYGVRYNEFRKRGLIGAAVTTAEAFVRDQAHYDTLLERLGGDSAALDQLHELGYLWRQDGSQLCEPGIPSLMDYVRVEASRRPAPVGKPAAV